MKIIYDSAIFNIQKYGGVSRYFTEIIRNLSLRPDTDISVIKSISRLPGRLKKFNDMFLNARLKLSGYDIYHPTYYSNNIKKRKRVKTVVTVYDMIHELYAGRFQGINSGIEIKRNSILSADHIICISNSSKKDLQKIYGIKDSGISVVYLGVSFDKLKIPENKTLVITDKPYMLYVGNREHYKNFNTFLKAFFASGIKDDFDLVCFGGGGFSSEEIGTFKKYDLSAAIKYIEGDDNLLKYYYSKAFALIYPSFYEGFGLPVLEAMANNCPVIASTGGSIPEIAGEAAMFFDPYKEELSLCIKRMINDNNIRSSYIKKGKERAGMFSWEKTAIETYNTYKEVLDK